MALDAATLVLIAQELESRLLSARIDKIFQPTRDEVVIGMRGRSESCKLFVSARSGSARIGITVEKFENPKTPPSFCMLLRKYLTGGRLDAVRVVPGERIVLLDFICTSEMGDTVTVTLAVELMGRYSNLVVVNGEGKIIDALKRVDFDASEIRQLLPGLPYTLPPKQDKLDFFLSNAEDVVAAACGEESEFSSALMHTAGGIGPVLCREISMRALGEGKHTAVELNSAQRTALMVEIDRLKAQHAAGGRPTTVHTAEGKPIEYSFTPLTQYLPSCTLTGYENYSALLDDYYSVKDAAERMRQKSRNLAKTVQNLYDRARRKQNARLEEQKESAGAESLRVCGELLQANLYAIEKGMRSITVENY
ncbi:MAG: NFACT family protein, partial [Pygmaiobacter sp.]